LHDEDQDTADASAMLWEQAQRQLAQQSADLDTLRTRAIAMLSVASLTAALFGSRLPHTHLSRLEATAVIVALFFFGASVLLALLIATPKKNAWRFTFRLSMLINGVLDGTDMTADVALSLANHAEESRMANQQKLECLYFAFRLVCILVGLQVVAWTIAVVL
jgi:hypothetical protein